MHNLECMAADLMTFHIQLKPSEIAVMIEKATKAHIYNPEINMRCYLHIAFASVVLLCDLVAYECRFTTHS